jgi:hypothetical protein
VGVLVFRAKGWGEGFIWTLFDLRCLQRTSYRPPYIGQSLSPGEDFCLFSTYACFGAATNVTLQRISWFDHELAAIKNTKAFPAKNREQGVFFFNAFILWNNEAVVYYVTFDLRNSTSYADPTLQMWDTFALATVLTLKLDPERPSQ